MPPKQKKIVNAILVALALIAVLIVYGIATQERPVVVIEPEVPKTPKERFENDCLSAWDGSCRELEKIVKRSMHDPDSYEHVSTRYFEKDSAMVLIMSYRGKNLFGGVVQSHISATVTYDCQVISVQ